MRLFAERGYERTSIAEIQSAAGLAPGSGALYKHFPSKEALLQAGMAQFIETNVKARALLKPSPDPAPAALRFLGVEAMRLLREERNDIRVAWRELEAFPDLHDRVERGVMQANYRNVAAWLEQRIAAGELPAQDSEAVAVALLGGLVMFRLYEAMWGRSPMGITAKRFVDAWSRLAIDGLMHAPSSAPPTPALDGSSPPRPASSRRKKAK